MTSRYSLLVTALLSLCVLTACKDKKGSRWYFDQQEPMGTTDSHPIVGDTTVVHEHREVAPFREVEISDASNVNIHIGPACQVRINGEKAYTDAQQVEVSGDVLAINYDDEMSRHHKTALDISAPSLTAVRLHNVQNVVFDGQDNKVGAFELAFKRVVMAHFNAPVHAENVQATIDGMTYGNFFFNCSKLDWTSRHISHARVMGDIGQTAIDEDKKGSVEIMKNK